MVQKDKETKSGVGRYRNRFQVIYKLAGDWAEPLSGGGGRDVPR